MVQPMLPDRLVFRSPRRCKALQGLCSSFLPQTLDLTIDWGLPGFAFGHLPNYLPLSLPFYLDMMINRTNTSLLSVEEDVLCTAWKESVVNL